MKNVINKISESTSISISLVIALMSGIFWLTNLSSKSEAMASRLAEYGTAQQDYIKNQMEILRRLSRIEGYLDRSKNR